MKIKTLATVLALSALMAAGCDRQAANNQQENGSPEMKRDADRADMAPEKKSGSMPGGASADSMAPKTNQGFMAQPGESPETMQK